MRRDEAIKCLQQLPPGTVINVDGFNPAGCVVLDKKNGCAWLSPRSEAEEAAKIVADNNGDASGFRVL